MSITISSMLDRYRPVERVSGISTAKRDKAPEILKGEQHAFDYVLKGEENALRQGEGKYTKDGSVYRKK